MKKILILFMTIAILAACNNNKAKGGLFGGLGGANKDNKDNKDNTNNNRSKDDYGNKDDKNKDDKNKDDRNKDDNNMNGNNNNKGGGSWSSSDKNTFLTGCKNSMPDNVQTANIICPCVLDKLQKEYADLNEADTKGGEDAGRRLAQECVADMRNNPDDRNGNNDRNKDDNNGGNGGNGGGGGNSTWTSSDRRNFVNDCAAEAEKGGMSQSKAENYCSCMQGKLEKIYPSAKDANRLTNDDFNTPDMKRMVKDCLGMDN